MSDTSHAGINPWLIAVTVTLATFMELLDTSIANVSLPHIAGGLAGSAIEHVVVTQCSRQRILQDASQYPIR